MAPNVMGAARTQIAAAPDDGGRIKGGPGSEPTYCFCNNVSYGDMIACDNEACMYEWFHFSCVGITRKPNPGELWYC